MVGLCYFEFQADFSSCTSSAVIFALPPLAQTPSERLSGGTITPGYSSSGTDNDYQDLVVEVQAIGVIPVVESSWGEVKALYR